VNAKAPQEIVMHDLVHELASIITADEFLVLDATEQKNWDISIHCRHVQLIKYKNQFNVFKHLPDKLRSLHFRNSHELQLPEKAFSRFKHIRILDLSSSRQNSYSLKTLPNNISNLYKLCYLDLSGNRSLNELPMSFGKLSNLSFLNLSGCSVLQALPKSICQLTYLQHLDMSKCCAIQNLPDKFGSLPNLLFLNLSGCSKLSKLPENVSLESLQHLDLSNCHDLENLPKDIGNQQNLVFLNLSCCYKVSELPESFCQLIHLKDLDISDCHGLKELPKCIGNLSELDTLNLTSCCKLQLLPESLCQMSKLRCLNLSYCVRLKELPSSFGKLKLHILDINCALLLQDLPYGLDTMSSLSQFEYMKLSHNLTDKANDIRENLKLRVRRTHIARPIENRRCSNLVELAQLTCHELDISHLYNVRDPEDAERVKLRDNSDLHMLALLWGIYDKDIYGKDISDLGLEALWFYEQREACKQQEQDKALLERLVPPRTLKHFYLSGYMSKDFPDWMFDISFYLPSLTILIICDLEECETLPSFGRLPNLRSLYLAHSPKIQKIGEEFYGGGEICTKLRLLHVKSMENLVEWWTTKSGRDNEEFLIPNLHSLNIVDCPKLKFVPYPPRSMFWMLNNSNEVLPEGGFGKLSSYIVPFQMAIRNCNLSPNMWHSLQHFVTLEDFIVHSCSSLRALPEVIGCFTILKELSLMSLKELQGLPECLGQLTLLEKVLIVDCPKLKSLPESMKNLTALTSLCLVGCEGLEMLPEWIGQLTSLQELYISLCPNVTSLPESIPNLIALNKLYIYGCPDLVRRCQREDANLISHIPKDQVTLLDADGMKLPVAPQMFVPLVYL
jgi:Leucine-rich repeat (LRR) protein